MSENDLHLFTADYLRGCCRCLFYHVPNQGKRSVQWAVKLKRLGVLAGTPDFCLVLDGGRAAFLELKAPKGRQRDGQRVFQANAEAAGAFYMVARTEDEVIGILKGWNAVRGSAAVNQILRGAAA